MRSFALLAFCWLAWCVTSAVPASAAGRSPAPLYENLGTHHHPITTASPLAQRYFDQGLIFAFAFNQAAATRSFLHAARLDPDCAMCYWGAALALGPTINDRMTRETEDLALALLQRASGLLSRVTDAEQAYILALAARYSADPAAGRHELDRLYADTMRTVAQRNPDDPDAAALFAEALMDTTPWRYWLPGGRPGLVTEEVLATLETVLARHPTHPQALHLYIHALEHSPHPERAEAAADRIRTVAPGAGHLVHMASHIYLRLGRYEDAAAANEAATRADEAVLADQGGYGRYGDSYYPHHMDFLWHAAAMAGDGDRAIAAARKAAGRATPEDLRKSPGLERVLAVPVLVLALAQFGRWAEVLKEPAPPEEFTYARGLWHYARGLAFAARGKPALARRERDALARRQRLEVPPMRGLSATKVLLGMAQCVLTAEIEGTRGRIEAMRGNYLVAIALQDLLPSDEMTPWYQPVRQMFGEALLRGGQPEQAELVFRDELATHPKNRWALAGLARSLDAIGVPDEAAAVRRQSGTVSTHAGEAVPAPFPLP